MQGLRGLLYPGGGSCKDIVLRSGVWPYYRLLLSFVLLVRRKEPSAIFLASDWVLATRGQ